MSSSSPSPGVEVFDVPIHPPSTTLLFFVLYAILALAVSIDAVCMCIIITAMSMHAIRMGIAETTCAVATDRRCGARCRGMLVAPAQGDTGGSAGFTTGAGAGASVARTGATETRGIAADRGAGAAPTQAGGSRAAEDLDRVSGQGRG